MVRWFLACFMVLGLAMGTVSAQDPVKNPPKGEKSKTRSLEEYFQDKDSNRDGHLSKEEFMKGATEEQKSDREKKFIETDLNKDGFVTKEELKTTLNKSRPQNNKKDKKDQGGQKGHRNKNK